MVSPTHGDGEGLQGIDWQFNLTNYFQNETSIEFAERVKHEIAKKGGLVELLWDGNLKRNKVRMLIDATLNCSLEVFQSLPFIFSSSPFHFR